MRFTAWGEESYPFLSLLFPLGQCGVGWESTPCSGVAPLMQGPALSGGAGTGVQVGDTETLGCWPHSGPVCCWWPWLHAGPECGFLRASQCDPSPFVTPLGQL